MTSHEDVLKFEEMGPLGDGTFGSVRKIRYNREVAAIKIFNKGDNRVKEFDKELQQLKRLSHENIIKVIAVGAYRDGNQIHKAIIMEYADMGSLHKVLHENKKIEYTLEHAINWLYQIANAFNYMHSAKPKAIIHRDLKPLNILLMKGGTLVKICDFGTACDLRKEMTAEMGTYLYMAPETLNGTDYDETCDVYSFGFVLWEIFTRKRPFFDKKIDSNLSFLWLKRSGDIKLTKISGLPTILQLLHDCCVSYEIHKRPKMIFVFDLMDTLNSIVNTVAIKPLKYDDENTTPYLSTLSITKTNGSPFISSECLLQKSNNTIIQQTQVKVDFCTSNTPFTRDHTRQSFHGSKISSELPVKKNQHSHKRSQSYGNPVDVTNNIIKSKDVVIEYIDTPGDFVDIMNTDPLKPLDDNQDSLKIYQDHCLLLKEDEELKTEKSHLIQQKEQLLKIIRDQDLYQNLLKQKALLTNENVKLHTTIKNLPSN